jgi:4-amino-4-deoxy-L-arabinose transferase-like glycosyltransferase
VSYPMIWAVRAVPVLVIFGALDLLKNDPPTPFLVLTLLRLGLGVLTLWAIHKQRRDRLALAYVVVVFLTCLPYPVRGGELLVLAGLALVVTAGDVLWQHTHQIPETG